MRSPPIFTYPSYNNIIIFLLVIFYILFAIAYNIVCNTESEYFLTCLGVRCKVLFCAYHYFKVEADIGAIHTVIYNAGTGTFKPWQQVRPIENLLRGAASMTVLAPAPKS